jgi:hypothetical protein
VHGDEFSYVTTYIGKDLTCSSVAGCMRIRTRNGSCVEVSLLWNVPLGSARGKDDPKDGR